ncbi:hypothetical protein [Pseudodesulfovibrio sediminis]|uniref:Lipoprotein n=1 Tax=Pseudodesulfovibrio sediminis TaxID=2810563 RepID=A0ABM7P326_9BACT|nr:hypothetical protein [Pseudodesulfovibrio sediminis]BCS87182.1 hypothetical protein PSDVSF_04240 [Pseudodesulfovibrio sediminis]
MQKAILTIVLLLFTLTVLGGCALGRKEWPQAVESEDTFKLKIIEGVRQDDCLTLNVGVTGATHRLWRASIQYEAVGSGEGEGCEGCPFVPRDAVHFTRDQHGFTVQDNHMQLSFCGLTPGTEYRFRVVGKSELPTMPLEYTDVYMSLP